MTDIGQCRETDRPARTSVMTKVQIFRDSKLAGTARVRNLSAFGLGGVSSVDLDEGEPVTVDIHGPGQVRGTVVWVSGNAFGVKFDCPIDPTSLKMNDVAQVSLAERFSFKQRYQPVEDYERPGFHRRPGFQSKH